MTVPVVYSLARQYPDTRITVLSRPYVRQLFEDLAPNVNFMEADIKREYRGVKGLNALYRRLVAKQFTHIADLHNVLRSEYLRMRFNLGRYRVEHINKNRKGKRRLVSQKNKKLEPLPTSIQCYMDVLERLGFPVKLEFKSIFATDPSPSPLLASPDRGGTWGGRDDIQTHPTGNINLLPAIFGPKKSFEQWIGIAPFAAHQGKIYPTEQMFDVICQLAEKYPQARIFLFGRGTKEDEHFPKWCQQLPQCINVGWHLETIYEELILMSHLDVMLTMDSANMHLASLVATPVVCVWGATHPYAGFMGYNQPYDNNIQLDMPCRPCSIFGNKPCMRGDYACMYDIKPEVIVEKIIARIEELKN